MGGIFMKGRLPAVEFFFNPDGVAVIGATDNPFKGGYHILNNILGGYQGKPKSVW